MYIQVGKKQKSMNSVILAASGVVLGAAAGAAATLLTDEKKRKMVGNTIKTTTKFAKDKALELHQKVNDMQEDTVGEENTKKVKRAAITM